MPHFKFDHLPQHLHPVCGEVFSLACKVDSLLQESAEKTAGLRKLMEARDCFVRAADEAKQPATENPVQEAARKGFESK